MKGLTVGICSIRAETVSMTFATLLWPSHLRARMNRSGSEYQVARCSPAMQLHARNCIENMHLK